MSKILAILSKAVDAPKLSIAIIIAILLITNGLGLGIGIAIGLAFYNIPHNISVIAISFINFFERLLLYVLLIFTTIMNFFLSMAKRPQINSEHLYNLIQRTKTSALDSNEKDISSD